jgi:putative transposase
VKPRRRSLRLSGYDYSTPGAYFITICTRDRRCILGEASEIVTACWSAIPQHFPQVTLDEFVIMPDHIHGIVILGDAAAPLSAVIGAFKSAASRQIGKAIWQRNYWEHTIRSDKSLNQIRQYIEENPTRLDTLEACGSAPSFCY